MNDPGERQAGLAALCEAFNARDIAGTIVVDKIVEHAYALEEHLLRRMEILP